MFTVSAAKLSRNSHQIHLLRSQAFSKLMCIGCPKHVDPMQPESGKNEKDRKSAEFRDLIMHGSEEPARKLFLEGIADVHQVMSLFFVEILSGKCHDMV
jgi:hypothetical protein